MEPSFSILRARCEDLDHAPRQFTERQRERHERIIHHGTVLLADYGRHNITFRGLAIGLNMRTATLRSHFADLDALIAEILLRHLLALSKAVGDISFDIPNSQEKRRALYLAHTRTAMGGLTAPHLLLVQELHTLPDEHRSHLEQTRLIIGETVAGPLAEQVLPLLDSPLYQLPHIETILAALCPPASPSEKPPPLTLRPPEKPAAPPLAIFHPKKKPRAAKIPRPDDDDPAETPGNWIFTCGIPIIGPPPTPTG